MGNIVIIVLFFIIIVIIAFIFVKKWGKKHSPKILGGGDIRFATKADVPAIKNLADLYQATLQASGAPPESEHSLEEVGSIALAEANRTLVFSEGGKMLGFVTATPSSSGGYKIRLLVVNPKARRSGVGGMLVTAVLKSVPEDVTVSLIVEKYNPMRDVLIAFYKKYGFRIGNVTLDGNTVMVRA